MLGAAEDGGYYLLGMTAPHAQLYAGIDLEHGARRRPDPCRGRGIGLPVARVAPWYDVDDRAALARLWPTWTPAPGSPPRPPPPRPLRLNLARTPARRDALLTARRFAALAAAGRRLLLLVVAEWLCHVPGSVATIGSDERLRLFVGLECVAALVYFAAVWLVNAGPLPRRATLLVLVLAAAMRVLPLASPPFLSSDLFRYVWDGRVQAQGINPYLYLPAAPELEFLRDDEIYTSTNRSEEAPTIYPPMAQVIFAAIGQVWSSLAMVKLAMAGFEAVAIGAVAWLLRRAGRPAAAVLIYAWNPLPIWEYAGNGHIDAASIGFVALAMLGWPAASADGPGPCSGWPSCASCCPPRSSPHSGAGGTGGCWPAPCSSSWRCMASTPRRGLARAGLPAGLRQRGGTCDRSGLLRPAGAGAVRPLPAGSPSCTSS